MFGGKQISSFLISLVAHIALLFGLFLFTLPGATRDVLFAIDSVIKPEDRERIDFEKKLDTKLDPSKTFNVSPGSISTKVGGRSASLAPTQKIEVQRDILNPKVDVRPSSQTLVGRASIADDLGSTEVAGSTQMLVRGYGDALDQLTHELIRLMRKDKLLVVWLFDESKSMKDDQQQIKRRIGKVFRELKIVDREAGRIGISKRIRNSRRKSKSLLKEIMLSSIISYGGGYHVHTKRGTSKSPQPTSDLPVILKAINSIPIDKTGKELTCAAMVRAISQHSLMATRGKRRLVLIVVSDESGDDGLGRVEAVIKRARKARTPIYILGRESVFGSLYAHVRWRQPETGRVYYLPIRRGPESAFPELLQHDGFRRRHDSHMSSFGPYDQVRICRDTGGIFFQLPYEQQNLNDFEAYKYNALALQEYKPDLVSRTEYALRRDRSRFRKAIADVVTMLNPYHPLNKGKGLELPDPTYQRFSANPAQFGPKVAKRGKQILRMLVVFEKAINHLLKVKPLRAREPSRRWRASYDLILAQLYWYQLRLFEYGIGMDQFVRLELKNRLTKNRKHNVWWISEARRGGSSRRFVLPDEVNQKRFKISPEDLQAKKLHALAQLREVEERHAGTPWAKRAAWEAKRPFGVRFGSRYQPPPKPGKSRPRPRPTLPPKL